jgi:hypothetical protein
MISNYKTQKKSIYNILSFNKMDYSLIDFNNYNYNNNIYTSIPKLIKNLHFDTNQKNYMIFYYPKLHENNIYIHQYHYWIIFNIYDFLCILLRKILNGLEDNNLLTDDNQDVENIFNFIKSGINKTQNKVSNNVSNEIKQMLNSMKAVMYNNKHLLETDVIERK